MSTDAPKYTRNERDAEERVRALVRQLGSMSLGRRERAERELREMGACAIRPMLAEYTRWTHHRGWFVVTCVALSLLWLVCAVASVYAWLRGTWSLSDAAYIMFTAALTTGTVIICLDGFHRMRLSRISAIVLYSHDREIIGVLIDEIGANRKVARKAMQKALARHLRKVTEHDRRLMSAGRLEKLRNGLAGTGPLSAVRDPALGMGILRVIELFGGEDCIRPVARLIEQTKRYRGRDRLRNAAEKCLAVVQARAEREKPGRTLLRPVGATDDTLLRPAGTAASDQEALLRTVDEEPRRYAVEENASEEQNVER